MSYPDNTKIYLIKGGKSLDLVKEWLAKFSIHSSDSTPSVDASHAAAKMISELFAIPLNGHYQLEHGQREMLDIGDPLLAFGLLIASGKGPYAMYVPDLAYQMQSLIKRHKGTITFDQALIDYKLAVEGCVSITALDWDRTKESAQQWEALAMNQAAWDVNHMPAMKVLPVPEPVIVNTLIIDDNKARNHQLLVALEIVRAGNCSKEEAHQLVDYVFNKNMIQPDADSLSKDALAIDSTKIDAITSILPKKTSFKPKI